MSDAHELIRNALKGDAAGGVDWQRLMAAVRAVAREGGEAGTPGSDSGGQADGWSGGLSSESESLLKDILAFDGHIELAEGSELPHAMPPEEMLKAHAVQALARADLAKHRAAIQRVADAKESSERLASIARSVLT